MIKQFIYNDEFYVWERIDRTQYYKGIKIETLTYHPDFTEPKNKSNHREYRLTYPNGEKSSFPINKRINIKILKDYIDFKIKYGKLNQIPLVAN